jgi:hypothetical protein
MHSINPVFVLISFDKLSDDILKQLVVSRICQPRSKAATVDYLKSYFDEEVELHEIYRYLAKLHKTQQDKVQEISVKQTKKILGGRIGPGYSTM